MIDQVERYMKNPERLGEVERKANAGDRNALALLRYWAIYQSLSGTSAPRNDNLNELLVKHFNAYLRKEINWSNPVFQAGRSVALEYAQRAKGVDVIPSEADHDTYRADWAMFISGFNSGVEEHKGNDGLISEV